MKRSLLKALPVLLCLALAPSAFAGKGNHCSAKALAGKWMFATAIGRQSLGGPFPPDKDITAIGVFKVDRRGNLVGKFDATVEDTFFLPDNTYTGTLVVNRDCTGTLSFVTSQGSTRTDSFVVVNRSELLAMSQDPANLWTYQMRRIGPAWGRWHHDD